MDLGYRWRLYHNLITSYLQKPIITHPKSLEDAFTLSYDKKTGKLVGWEAREQSVGFGHSNSRMEYSEYARVKDERFFIKYHKYMFFPVDGLLSFRIDFNGNDQYEPHINPDPSLEQPPDNWPHHLHYCEHHRLNIENFNLLFAIAISMAYIQCKVYPIRQGRDDDYNQLVEKLRRALE